jgi:hypothetical protein
MVANTSSRGHPLQHEFLVSPISDETTDYLPVPSADLKSKTWAATVTRVPSWPEEARQLKKHDWVSVLFALGDVILVVLPIYFVCKPLITLP